MIIELFFFFLCFLQDGYWADRACEQSLGYICKMKSQAQTPGIVEVETGCRRVSTERTQWFHISKYDVIALFLSVKVLNNRGQLLHLTGSGSL